MLTDDLKNIKILADEIFAEVSDSNIEDDIKYDLLSNLDEISALAEMSLRVLS